MKSLRDMSIIWKLNLLVAAISAAVLLLASAVFVLQYRYEYKKTMTAAVEALASVVGFSSAPALLFEDHAAATQSLSALGAKKDIAAAFIYDTRGVLFSSFNPKNLQPEHPSHPPQESWHYFDDTYLHLFHTIEINETVVGTIYIMHSMEQLRRRQIQYSLTAAGIFLACFILTILLSFFFQKVITSPIFSLISTVRKISHEKNYSLRAVKRTGDEIGVLIDGFNEMVHEIQSRDLYLEEKVARRTAELKTANDNLVAEMQERRQIERDRENLIAELRLALNEVKTLSGLLPICCACKKIRNDKGYWLQIETYVQEHSNAEFSHGICPDCAKKLYPDFYQEK
jgi:two-component system, sensor histidine kinase